MVVASNWPADVTTDFVKAGHEFVLYANILCIFRITSYRAFESQQHSGQLDSLAAHFEQFMCVHSDTRMLMRSATDVWWWGLGCSHHSMFSRVEVRALGSGCSSNPVFHLCIWKYVQFSLFEWMLHHTKTLCTILSLQHCGSSLGKNQIWSLCDWNTWNLLAVNV